MVVSGTEQSTGTGSGTNGGAPDALVLPGGCQEARGSPNRNRQVERRVERQVESQGDDLFGSKKRQPDFLPDVLPDIQPDDFYLETPQT